MNNNIKLHSNSDSITGFDLADKLDNIAMEVSIADLENSKETLLTAKNALKQIDQISQENEIHSLRAVSHWMLLNIDESEKSINSDLAQGNITPKNENNQTSSEALCSSGSYFNWIELLPAILRNEDPSLFQDLYDSLQEPNWFIKPSNLLLSDLIKWLEKSTNTQANIEKSTTPNKSEAKLKNDAGFDLIDVSSEQAPTLEKAKLETQNNIQEKSIVTASSPTSKTPNTKLSTDECFGLLNVELDELVMGLFELSSSSGDVLLETSKFNNKLEQLIKFTDKCSYRSIAQVTRWCQRNLDLFAREKSQIHYRFIDSGECWTWLELLSYGITEPDELSNASMLSTELNREEWLEPIAIEDLQNLLLFLQNPKAHDNSLESETTSQETIIESKGNDEIKNTKTVDDRLDATENKQTISTAQEQSNLKFTWDDDIHPELLAAYLEETPDLVEDLAALLHKISNNQTSKEEQHNASRLAHTVKGSSAVLGITALSEYSHKLEDILDYSVNNDLSTETADFLSESSDCLENLFDSVQNQQAAPEEFFPVLKKLEQFANTLANSNQEDDTIELSASPILPDFIKQTNSEVTEASKGLAESTPEEKNTSENKQTISTAQEQSNLKFTWDDDIHPELLAAYLEETPDLVEDLAALLHKISNNQASKEEQHNASRLAHTVKGSSAVLGITALSEYSHKLEDILDYSVNNDLSAETADFLSESSDCLENLFDSVQNQQAAPEEFFPVLKKLEQFANTLANSNQENDTIELSASPVLPDFITQTNSEKTEAPKDLTESTPDEENTSLSRLEEGFDIKDFTAEIDDIAMSLASIDTDTKLASKLDKAQEELQRLDLLSDISGYPEISKLSQWCQQNITSFKEKKTDKETTDFIESGECWTWIELIAACLADPEEKSYLALLSQELMRPEWSLALNKEDLQSLLLLLNRVQSTEQSIEPETETESKPNPTDKTIEDTQTDLDNSKQSGLSLKWDEDIHPELLDVYLQETPDQIVEAAQLIRKVVKNEASKEDHQHAARIVHTIKGASGVVGITALAEFTHKLEDILDYSVDNKLPSELSKLLAESADCLEDLFETIINKEQEPKEFAPTLEKLTEYAKNLDDISDEPADVELKMPELPDFIQAQSSSVETKPAENNEQPKSSAPTPKTAAKTVTKTAPSIAKETHIKVPIAVIDKLLNLAGELVTATTQVSDKIKNSLETNKQIKKQDIHVHKMLEELTLTISQQEKNQSSMLSSLKDKSEHESENSNLDSLEMDTYNELHSIAGLLTESILDTEEVENLLGSQLNELTEYARSLTQLNKELSDTILHSRMISISSFIPRLERIVRQTCRKTGKKAELAISGNEINIDTDILNKFADPLLHLLRNSIDHGIESPEERKAKGKYETGRIHLAFSREGKYIHMELKDDGAGIDPDIIYHKALKMGLIDENKDYTEKEIIQLILHPGFSTQAAVTDISGRGVGMDVVANAVKQLKGSLEISSKKGEGTTFAINVPLTLVTSGTLLIEIAGTQIAIPVETIEQLSYLAPNEVIEKNGAHFIKYEENELPIISLASLLDWPATKPDFTDTNTLLIIKGKEQLHAVYVDKIIHSREVVIKSLAPWINSEKGLIGACHLADGGVAPVINLSQIVAQTEENTESAKKYQVTTIEPVNVAKATPKILVVDDSLSNRKALSLIIEQTEYDVLTAVDGLDALKVMNENQIDIVYTDLEMPRMNGLELTQSIRAWDAKKRTPVIMITSRTTTKHQQLAVKAGVNQYLTKPVMSKTLIDSIESWLAKIHK